VWVDFLWFALLVAIVGGLWYLAYRIEPHYSSKDGKRFLCTAQVITLGTPTGRPKETRVALLGDGTLVVMQKAALRRNVSDWVLVGKQPDPPKRTQVYLANQVKDGVRQPDLLALRIPTKSRVTPLLDEILAARERSGRPSAPQ